MAEINQFGSMLDTCWSNLAKIGQFLARMAEVGRLWAESRFSPNVVDHGPHWPIYVEIPPKLCTSGIILTDLDRVRPRFGFGRI